MSSMLDKTVARLKDNGGQWVSVFSAPSFWIYPKYILAREAPKKVLIFSSCPATKWWWGGGRAGPLKEITFFAAREKKM